MEVQVLGDVTVTGAGGVVMVRLLSELDDVVDLTLGGPR